MNKVIQVLCKGICCLAMAVSIVSVNATCSCKIYQGKLPEELNQLRRHG